MQKWIDCTTASIEAELAVEALHPIIDPGRRPVDLAQLDERADHAGGVRRMNNRRWPPNT